MGLTLALVADLIASNDDLQPGDSKLAAYTGTTIFFGLAFVATLYAARSAAANARKWAIFRVVWPVGAVWFSFWTGLSAISDWNSVQRFDREGKEVQGEVTYYHPHDHNTMGVGYTVARTSYESRTFAPGDANAWMPGDHIEVYYYASAPSGGFCRKPRWQPATLLEGWVLAAGIGPALLAFLAGHFPPRRPSSAGNDVPNSLPNPANPV